MRAIAVADGEETEQERALLTVAQEALGQHGALESFSPLAPSDPALTALDPAERERLVQSMLLMAIIDGRGAREEAALIEAFAKTPRSPTRASRTSGSSPRDA